MCVCVHFEPLKKPMENPEDLRRLGWSQSSSESCGPKGGESWVNLVGFSGDFLFGGWQESWALTKAGRGGRVTLLCFLFLENSHKKN